MVDVCVQVGVGVCVFSGKLFVEFYFYEGEMHKLGDFYIGFMIVDDIVGGFALRALINGLILRYLFT